MAEGLFGGILSEDEEVAPQPRLGRKHSRHGSHAGCHPEHGNAARTAAFLEEQTKLVIAQRKSVEAEHRYLEREWRPRLFGMWLRAAFHVFMALVATVIEAAAKAKV